MSALRAPSAPTTFVAPSVSNSSVRRADAPLSDEFFGQRVNQIASTFAAALPRGRSKTIEGTAGRSLRDESSVLARAVFCDYMAEVFGIQAQSDADLALLINRYLQENGTLDFGRDPRLTDALGREFDIYGALPGEDDAAPGWRQEMGRQLLLALVGDAQLPKISDAGLSDFAMYQVAMQAPAYVDRWLRTLPSLQGLTPQVSRLLAVQMAPLVLGDPTLRFTLRGMYYGDRQWGDLRVGIQVAQSSGLDWAQMTADDLVAFGQQALNQEAVRSLQAPDDEEGNAPGVSLAQFKLLARAMALGRIEPAALSGAGSESDALQKLQDFILEDTQLDRVVADAWSQLGNQPSRREMVENLLRAAGLDPFAEVYDANQTLGQTNPYAVDVPDIFLDATPAVDGLVAHPMYAAYLDGIRFDGDQVLPPVSSFNQRFDDAFNLYRAQSKEALQRLLIAQIRLALGRELPLEHPIALYQPQLSYQVFKTRLARPSLFEESVKVENRIDQRVLGLRPLSYILRGTDDQSGLEQYYFFSAQEFAQGLQTIPVSSDAELEHWIASHRDRVFGQEQQAALAQELKQQYSNGLGDYRLKIEANCPPPMVSRLADAAQTVADSYAVQIDQQKTVAYAATAQEQAAQSLLDFVLGFIPFYDMAKAIKDGDVASAIANGVLDLISLIPAIGKGAKLAAVGTRTVTVSIRAATLALSKNLVKGCRLAAQAALKASLSSVAQHLPKIAQTSTSLGMTLLEDLLPIGLPNVRAKWVTPRQLGAIAASLTDSRPTLASALASGNQLAQFGVRKQGNLFVMTSAASQDVRDGLTRMAVMKNGKETLYPVGDIGAVKDVVLKRHENGAGNVFYTAVDPASGKSFGPRLGMVEIAAPACSPRLVVNGSPAHRLEMISVKDAAKIERLSQARVRDPSARSYLDGSDRFIQMDGQWFRYMADKGNGHSGLIFKEGSLHVNYDNRVIFGANGWAMDRGAQLLGGWPSSVTPPRAVIGEDALAEMAANWRRQTGGAIEPTRNVAIAEVLLNGRERTVLKSVSGGLHHGESALPVRRRYRPLFLTYSRGTDSEVKILESFYLKNSRAGRPQPISGVINLFTERPPCFSCSSVISRFARDFPRVRVNISYLAAF